METGFACASPVMQNAWDRSTGVRLLQPLVLLFLYSAKQELKQSCDPAKVIETALVLPGREREREAMSVCGFSVCLCVHVIVCPPHINSNELEAACLLKTN